MPSIRLFAAPLPCRRPLAYGGAVSSTDRISVSENDALRVRVPRQARRHKYPKASSLDSWGGKTMSMPAVRSYDPSNRSTAASAILVDILGLWLAAAGAAPLVQDRDGACLLVTRLGRRAFGGGERGRLCALGADRRGGHIGDQAVGGV
jgi:hypothetical protein